MRSSLARAVIFLRIVRHKVCLLQRSSNTIPPKSHQHAGKPMINPSMRKNYLSYASTFSVAVLMSLPCWAKPQVPWGYLPVASEATLEPTPAPEPAPAEANNVPPAPTPNAAPVCTRSASVAVPVRPTRAPALVPRSRNPYAGTPIVNRPYRFGHVVGNTIRRASRPPVYRAPLRTIRGR